MKYIIWGIILMPSILLSQNVEYGTTVITHGFQPTGASSSVLIDGEAYDLAESILNKAGKGKILKYNKSTGKYISVKSLGKGGENILLFDWRNESNNNIQGYAEAAADALFASLLQGHQSGTFNLKDIHFIGHSRGTVVNTLAVERLIVLKKKYPSFYPQITIDQVTNIDPHDWGLAGIASDMNDAHTDIVINNPLEHNPNNGTISWQGIFSDTYYQTTSGVNIDGRPVVGTMNFHWNENDEGLPLIHFGINGIQNLGYRRTIDSNIKMSIAGGPEGGYHLSRIGGESNLRPTSIFGGSVPTFDFYSKNSTGRITGILNGSFDRSNVNNIPGWDEHGGSIYGNTRVKNGELILNPHISQPKPYAKHNRFYIPNDAKNIMFLVRSISPNDGQLKVYINNKVEYEKLINSSYTQTKEAFFDVSAYQNQIVTLTFKYTSISFGVESKIAIDEVQLSQNTAPSSCSTLFLFDLSGSMNSIATSSTLTKLQEAKNASKITLNSLANNSSNVNHKVAVYGFYGACRKNPTTIISEFSDDFSNVEKSINRMTAKGGTPLAEAIDIAECELAEYLSENNQDNGRLIILSDGSATCGSIRPEHIFSTGQESISVNADLCGGQIVNSRQTKIRCYTIGFNIEPGSSAERDLQYISQCTGGRYFNAQNQSDLERAFNKFNKVYQPKEQPKELSLTTEYVTIFTKGVQQIKSESYKKALATCERYVSKYPNDCNGVYNLALMQEANDIYGKAISNLKKYQQICPHSNDIVKVKNQIIQLEEEFEEYKEFQCKTISSDLAFLKEHFEKIQNGNNHILAEEFKGFLKEKGNFYRKLPNSLGKKDKIFTQNCKSVADGLSKCSRIIRKSKNTWSQDGIPTLSMTHYNLKQLVDLLGHCNT